MAYNINALKNDLIGVLHGTTLNQISNVDGLIYRAARQVIRDVDPQETIRIIPFVTPIYSSVYDYASPVDLKGTKVIDIRPQVNRYASEVWLQTYNQAFDLAKQRTLNDLLTVNFNTAVKTIRLASPDLPPGILLNNATETTNWSVGGTASNLQVDNVNFVSGGSSLSLDLAAGANPSTGNLSNSQITQTALDLSELENQGTLFLYTYLPTASEFNSVTLQWGTDSSNYWSVAATMTQQSTVFQNGWNLLAYNWLGATVTGTPDASDINYVNVIWNYDGIAQTAVRLNNIIAYLGTILEIEYYSKYMFRDATTGAFQEEVTDGSNLINLDTDSYDLLFYQVAYLAAQQQQGKNALQFDAKYFLELYQDAVARYKAMYKSQVQKPQQIYYKQPNPSTNQWWGRGRYGY